jgi:hypothetical protein
MKNLFVLTLALLVPGIVMAQATNEGAKVVAPFLVTPPTIDGVVSDGEWDAAATAEGDWSDHGSTTLADPAYPTTVKVAYGLQGLYILYDCVDDEVLAIAGGSEYLGSGPTVEGQGQPFTFGGATDYLATYIDPTNYADNLPGADNYSYSIQGEPAVTATDGAETASYTYTEAGQSGSFKRRFVPPIEATDGTLHYWAGGISWELPENALIVDGPTENGYVMEWFLPWNTFDGYFPNWASQVSDALADIDQDATDPVLSANALVHSLRTADGVDNGYPGLGNVTGMPLPGTQWKIQFSRYTEMAAPQYTNWVGDTGGFVTRPFGTLEFGTAEASDIRDAMLHLNN